MEYPELSNQVNEIKKAKEMRGNVCSLLERNASTQASEEIMRSFRREQLIAIQACMEDKDAKIKAIVAKINGKDGDAGTPAHEHGKPLCWYYKITPMSTLVDEEVTYIPFPDQGGPNELNIEGFPDPLDTLIGVTILNRSWPGANMHGIKSQSASIVSSPVPIHPASARFDAFGSNGSIAQNEVHLLHHSKGSRSPTGINLQRGKFNVSPTRQEPSTRAKKSVMITTTIGNYPLHNNSATEGGRNKSGEPRLFSDSNTLTLESHLGSASINAHPISAVLQSQQGGAAPGGSGHFIMGSSTAKGSTPSSANVASTSVTAAQGKKSPVISSNLHYQKMISNVAAGGKYTQSPGMSQTPASPNPPSSQYASSKPATAAQLSMMAPDSAKGQPANLLSKLLKDSTKSSSGSNGPSASQKEAIRNKNRTTMVGKWNANMTAAEESVNVSQRGVHNQNSTTKFTSNGNANTNPLNTSNSNHASPMSAFKNLLSHRVSFDSYRKNLVLANSILASRQSHDISGTLHYQGSQATAGGGNHATKSKAAQNGVDLEALLASAKKVIQKDHSGSGTGAQTKVTTFFLGESNMIGSAKGAGEADKHRSLLLDERSKKPATGKAKK